MVDKNTYYGMTVSLIKPSRAKATMGCTRAGIVKVPGIGIEA